MSQHAWEQCFGCGETRQETVGVHQSESKAWQTDIAASDASTCWKQDTYTQADGHAEL